MVGKQASRTKDNPANDSRRLLAQNYMQAELLNKGRVN